MSDRIKIFTGVFAVLLLGIVVYFKTATNKMTKYLTSTSDLSISPTFSPTPAPTTNPTPTGLPIPEFAPPMNRVTERATKKTFGMFILPETSPVQPERFRGYHTGVDLEVFPEELASMVWVKAICTGQLDLKKYASGYGGIAVQLCELDRQPVTVIYGHLKLGSVKSDTGQLLKTGDVIGELGQNNSIETDGERKHLHLGVHIGKEINIRGYVDNKAGLSGWIDPMTLFLPR